MSLDKSDLQAIDNIVTKIIRPVEEGHARVEKKIDKIDKKFDKLFNFIDRDVSFMKKGIALRLGMKVSELSAPEN
jgi:hypothetical protein